MKTLTKTTTVRARLEPELKDTVEGVFEQLGLTTSEAITIFFNQVALKQGLPFPVKIPNKETRKAIADAKAGKGMKKFSTVEELFAELEN
ncbi:type II toxin-antitoxin system RelB/DinJ family antitoxin [Candidatus Pacebacteria bacterium]|nr:type II toxin-antitoxin system RelB/DinJ family antitoxin [Candidatus Paceibacterota bacterium]